MESEKAMVVKESCRKGPLGKADLQKQKKTKSDRTVRRADEIAEDGDIGSVGADAARVHREAESFGLFEINACVVEFRQAETVRRQNAIQARRINRSGWTMTAPRPTSYLVELLPIAFLPSGHYFESLFLTTILLQPWMRK